jgi:hypothetical protein
MDHLKDNLLKSINQELSKESNKVIQEINELVIFNSGGVLRDEDHEASIYRRNV